MRAVLILVALLTCAAAHAATRFVVDGQLRPGPEDIARWYAHGNSRSQIPTRKGDLTHGRVEDNASRAQ